MKTTYRYLEKTHFVIWQGLAKYSQWAKSRPTAHVGNSFIETQACPFSYIIVYGSFPTMAELSCNRDCGA